MLYGLGENRRVLGILAGTFTGDQFKETGYYELDGEMNLVRKDDKKTADFIRTRFTIPRQIITIDESSVLIIDDFGRRWRLPVADKAFVNLTMSSSLRLCREVATERDLFICAGTSMSFLPTTQTDSLRSGGSIP